MELLFLYWGMLLIGYFVGTKSRSRKEQLYWIGTLLFAAITLLLFGMGIRMGSNKEVMENLHTIGLDAFFITVVTMAGSIAAVMATRKLLGIDRYGRIKGAEAVRDFEHDSEATERDAPPMVSSKEGSGEKGNSSRTTLVILVSVILGIICGYLFVPKLFPDYSYFEHISGNVLTIGISILLLLLGTDLGLSGTVISSLKRAGLRVLAFPAAVVLGTLAAAFLCGLVLSISQKEALAIGAGFGWTALSPVIITEQGYVIAGAMAFIHNIMRQLFGIVLLPLVAQRIGYIEAISLPGIATMDICLPLVERFCGEKIVIYSLSMGLLLSAVVPLLVPLIIGL